MKFIRVLAIVLNGLLVLLCVTYFLAHGLPTNLILWASATLWLIAPLVNLYLLNKEDSKYLLTKEYKVRFKPW